MFCSLYQGMEVTVVLPLPMSHWAIPYPSVTLRLSQITDTRSHYTKCHNQLNCVEIQWCRSRQAVTYTKCTVVALPDDLRLVLTMGIGCLSCFFLFFFLSLQLSTPGHLLWGSVVFLYRENVHYRNHILFTYVGVSTTYGRSPFGGLYLKRERLLATITGEMTQGLLKVNQTMQNALCGITNMESGSTFSPENGKSPWVCSKWR